MASDVPASITFEPVIVFPEYVFSTTPNLIHSFFQMGVGLIADYLELVIRIAFAISSQRGLLQETPRQFYFSTPISSIFKYFRIRDQFRLDVWLICLIESHATVLIINW